MSRIPLSAGFIAGIFAAVSVTHAASIAQYTFPTGPVLSATTLDPNATASNVTFGTAVNAPVSTNDFWLSKPVVSLSRLNDTASQAYFEATITAVAGYQLNLDSFTFDGARGGPSTPRIHEVHSNVAGLARDADISPAPPTSLTSGNFEIQRGPIGSTDPLPTITADLSSAAYDNLTSLTMRVYFYTPTTNQNIDIDNVTFNGGVFAIGATIGTWNVATAGNWHTAGNWSGGVPNAIGSEAKFLSAINATRTIFADTPVTVGTLRFDNANTYHVTGGASMTLEVSISASALVQVQQGTHKINLPLTMASDTDLEVATGATLKISDPVTISPGVVVDETGTGTVTYESTVTVQSGSIVAMNSAQNLPALSIASAATAKTNGGNATRIDNLALDAAGKLDVNNGGLILTGESVGDLRAALLAGSGGAGFAAQTWDQPGIMSTAASADPLTYGVGYMDNDNFILGAKSTFDGVSVPGGAMLVKSTLSGDADLDWDVDDDDVTVLGIFYGGPGHWYEADFDYTGIVDDDDVTIIGITYGQSLSGASGISAVPEPSCAVVIGACVAAGMFHRRRRV